MNWFQPFENPIGLGASDYLELLVALLLLAFAFLRPWIEPHAQRLARRPALCMIALAAIPAILRLILLPNHPAPAPDIGDEFSHLLVADTLRHFRLANAMHPMRRFFETIFVLQEPAYASIYPLGQGAMLALGRALSGIPWTGVVLSSSAFCALAYWALRAWTTPGWALIGGLLAVMEFGPLSAWMNVYWGGSLPACAGCLVYGALPRLLETRHWRNAGLLGFGFAVHALTRPYESIFLLLSVVLFFAAAKRIPAQAAAALAVSLAFAGGLTLLLNWRVTGSWTTLPYQLNQSRYGVPASLTFQPTPEPHGELTPQQQLQYKMQSGFRGAGPETPGKFFERLEYRVRFYRFFFLVPLYLALAAFLLAFRTPHWWWIVATVTLFALGTNFFPAFQLHYVAGVVCLFLLMSVRGLERLGPAIATVVLLFCAGHFLFWYGTHLFEGHEAAAEARRYEVWNGVNHGNPARRIRVNQQLAAVPGSLLVFVRYSPGHIFQEEWVYNEAEIDAARVVWARDRGAAENDELRRYYPNRTVLLLETEGEPLEAKPYPREPPALPPPPEPPSPPADRSKPNLNKPTMPRLRFEEVK